MKKKFLYFKCNSCGISPWYMWCKCSKAFINKKKGRLTSMNNTYVSKIVKFFEAKYNYHYFKARCIGKLIHYEIVFIFSEEK